VAELSPEEKGLVLGAVLARTSGATLARYLAPVAAGRCAAAIEALSAASKAEREAAVAALLALVRAPVPGGLERIDPGWLRERFAREPSDVVRAVSAGLSNEVGRAADAVLTERGDGGLSSSPPRAPARGRARQRARRTRRASPGAVDGTVPIGRRTRLVTS
jgi:hypothetical protein